MEKIETRNNRLESPVFVQVYRNKKKSKKVRCETAWTALAQRDRFVRQGCTVTFSDIAGNMLSEETVIELANANGEG